MVPGSLRGADGIHTQNHSFIQQLVAGIEKVERVPALLELVFE